MVILRAVLRNTTLESCRQGIFVFVSRSGSVSVFSRCLLVFQGFLNDPMRQRSLWEIRERHREHGAGGMGMLGVLIDGAEMVGTSFIDTYRTE